MRRFLITIALATLLAPSICIAQQAASDTSKAGDRNGSGVLPPGAVLGGMGTTNYIPIWAHPNFLLDSVIYQDGSGNIGVGTATPGTKLDVNGGINTEKTYSIEGNSVISIGNQPDYNLFLGPQAGAHDITGQGKHNVFTGTGSGFSNTTGYDNTFVGYGSGSDSTTAIENTLVGNQAGGSNLTGSYNTITGSYALGGDGSYDTVSGYEAGGGGSFNTAIGSGTGINSGGSYNIFLGYLAGADNISGNNDIYIGNRGPGTGLESSAIRIGDPANQSATYIAGIFRATTSGGVPVYIDSNGQLGTMTSSLRFKEQIRNMGDSTSALMKLRPVTFLYKPKYDKGERLLQYGLIAEEVARVYPELVAYDNSGQPYSVRYQYLGTMLLNEVQKQYHRAEAQAELIQTQEQKIDELQQRLSRLEALVGMQVKTVVSEQNSSTDGVGAQ